MDNSNNTDSSYIESLWLDYYSDFLSEIEVDDPEAIDNSIFIPVYEENYKEVIDDYCKKLEANIQSRGKSVINSKSLNPLKKILESLPRPYTMVQEPYHIDRVYRDSYYRYFSSQHFHVRRYSRRISFFGGIFTSDDYYAPEFQSSAPFEDNVDNEGETSKDHPYYGSLVINPLITGLIGRTLIDPHYLIKEKDYPAFVRLSNFKVHIYGRKWRVKAFPYRMQDGETMRCAEVTILNMIEYYGNTYPEYRNALPSDILEEEKRHSHERVLPSRGTNYAILSKMLTRFEFSPRLYDIYSIDTINGSKTTEEVKLKRWLFYYMESGIPVAVNLSTANRRMIGHSLVCIGRGTACSEGKKKAFMLRQIPFTMRANGHAVINAADYYEDFIVIDDNEPVYQLRKYNQLSLNPDLKVSMLVAPLYKRMYLDAPDAEQLVYAILHDEKLGIDAWTSGNKKEGEEAPYLDDGENVVMRLFMTSSSSFKRFRTRTLDDIDVKELYASIPMPRFVWICELYRENVYNDEVDKYPCAFAEIVIDATSSPTKQNPVKGLVLMHYPGKIGHRFPNDTSVGFEDMYIVKNDKPFVGFNGNLLRID